MFDEKTRALLEQPLVARLAVNGPDGYPHVVPIWYMLDGEEIVMVTHSTAAKVRLLRANPKAGVTIGGDVADLANGIYHTGYLILGLVTIEPDDDFAWLRRMAYRYDSPEQAEKDLALWTQEAQTVLRLRPEKIIKVM